MKNWEQMQCEVEGKKLHLLNFINQLIEDPEFCFCVDFDYFMFGMLDAPFIMDEKILSLQEIKDLVKSKKKVSIKAIFNELRKVFEGISDYVLMSDPLQLSCQAGIKKVNEFEHSLMQRNFFVSEDSGSETTSFRSSVKPNTFKPLSFLKQLQMAFYLINLD